jgi:hypothetical protein
LVRRCRPASPIRLSGRTSVGDASGFIVLHVLAALHHQFILNDGLLRRMVFKRGLRTAHETGPVPAPLTVRLLLLLLGPA